MLHSIKFSDPIRISCGKTRRYYKKNCIEVKSDSGESAQIPVYKFVFRAALISSLVAVQDPNFELNRRSMRITHRISEIDYYYINRVITDSLGCFNKFIIASRTNVLQLIPRIVIVKISDYVFNEPYLLELVRDAGGTTILGEETMFEWKPVVV
ncbi:hypothetical protein C4561_01785 [candidate division WWE3 bacterium]|uniref:Uncharacterized protein n=1 Tax=candidate division WWE3 bacterium TaxID=2053526 RepID=A0A3A4ZLT7_UNCKA|nr:MAG: hypothetical protein C4561_01785 [candidate division WWE3 bacterium]